MERKSVERKNVIFKVELLSGGKSYKGIIKNISEDGAYIEIVPTKNVNDFIPETTLEVKLQLLSGETLSLQYEVVWLYSKKFSPDGLKQNIIGVKIIEPSKKLNNFLKTL